MLFILELSFCFRLALLQKVNKLCHSHAYYQVQHSNSSLLRLGQVPCLE